MKAYVTILLHNTFYNDNNINNNNVHTLYEQLLHSRITLAIK